MALAYRARRVRHGACHGQAYHDPCVRGSDPYERRVKTGVEVGS